MARRELGPATLSVVHAVSAALSPVDTELLVACSGGADSLALAYATTQAARHRDVPVAAIVVDHGLQPDSADVAARTAGQLRHLGFTEVALRRVEVDDTGGGPEAAARSARYAALAEAARPRGSTVLLGHTLDDQAETVLLGLARGSGIRSLAGMAERTGGLLRPLLGLRRTTTAQACAEVGLQPWSDPHNADPAFSRVRVRLEVLPVLERELGPGVAEALGRTAGLARDDADLLDQLTAECDPGRDDLSVALLAELPRALRTRLIRRWLHRHGAAEVAHQHVVRVEKLVLDWHGQGPAQLPGVVVQRFDGALHVLG